MSKTNHVPISSTELGTLWMAYQDSSMIIRLLQYFIAKADTEEALTVLQYYHDQASEAEQMIRTIFEQEGAAIPTGFTENDVNIEAPLLFDFKFDLMFLRVLTKVGMGLYALFTSMSYREDIRKLYRQLTFASQETYDRTTQILLEIGVLARPPYVSMPTDIEFVRDKTYMSGFNLFSEKRPLNTIEVAHIYQAIETNGVGMQLMTGYAQAAEDKEVKDYLFKGSKLAKKFIAELSTVLMEDDLQPPAAWAGKATDSTTAPFSDKLMMYNTSVLSTFGLGSNALGGAFSLRNDLPTKMTRFAADIFTFSKEGGKIMIKNNWMEEPPQIENRKHLIQG